MTNEKVIAILSKMKNCYLGEVVDVLDFAIEAVKAQEPIKPQVKFNLAGQPMWACGNCGTTLFFKFPRQTDDEDQRSEHRFCHYCGRAVKWE